jgi:hypothetical protein
LGSDPVATRDRKIMKAHCGTENAGLVVGHALAQDDLPRAAPGEQTLCFAQAPEAQDASAAVT